MNCSGCLLRVIAFDREGYAILSVSLLICSGDMLDADGGCDFVTRNGFINVVVE